MKRTLLIISLLGVLLAQFAAAQAVKTSVEGSKEERLYSDGTQAINEGRWAEAESAFDKVIALHGKRAEGALYWKAYAENKAGQSSKALATCVELRRAYPKSSWLDECSALEIEVRGKSGQPVLPHNEQDQDLKLLALNSLMMQDEARAFPLIQQILNGNQPEQMKERALFVLAQSGSKQSQELLGQIARGQSNPNLQVKAIQMLAALRGRRSTDTLTEIYQTSSDERVKKAVIQAYLVSGNPTKLVDLAQHERDQTLARNAVHTLGAMGAVDDLLSLYKGTSSAETKSAILDSFIASGHKGADALGNIATSEQDSSLRRKAIRNLGIAGGGSAVPALVDAYHKSSDSETKKAALQGLFLAGAAHDLVALAKAEKDPAMKQSIVEQLSVMHNKEASDYMLELLK